MAQTKGKQGISRRAYAARRGCSEKAIRNRILDGTLTAALLANGRLDAEKADKLLAAGTTAGARTSRDLAEARRRKAAAAVALLIDEIAALEADAISRAHVCEAARGLAGLAAWRLWQLIDVAPQAMGRSIPEAARILDDAVGEALNDLANTEIVEKETDAPGKAATAPALNTLSAVELATVRADLLARKMEIQHELNRGERVAADHAADVFYGSTSTCRAHMMSLHVKAAPQIAETTDPDDARALAAREIASAIAELPNEFVTAAEIAAEFETRLLTLPDTAKRKTTSWQKTLFKTHFAPC